MARLFKIKKQTIYMIWQILSWCQQKNGQFLKNTRLRLISDQVSDLDSAFY